MKQNLVWLRFLVFQNGVVSETVFQHQLCSFPIEQQRCKWQAFRKRLSPAPCSGEGYHVLQKSSTSIFLMILQNPQWGKIHNVFPYLVSLLLQTGCCADSKPQSFCSKLCLMSEWQLEKKQFFASTETVAASVARQPLSCCTPCKRPGDGDGQGHSKMPQKREL